MLLTVIILVKPNIFKQYLKNMIKLSKKTIKLVNTDMLHTLTDKNNLWQTQLIFIFLLPQIHTFDSVWSGNVLTPKSQFPLGFFV